MQLIKHFNDLNLVYLMLIARWELYALILYNFQGPSMWSAHFYYIGSAEGHEYPDLQVGDEVNPRPVFIFS
jgi:hypothetical protein